MENELSDLTLIRVYKWLHKLELVQLSVLPQERWMGRGVIHPSFQMGKTPYWRLEDAPPPHYIPGEDEGGFDFDVGIVVSFEPSDWRGSKEELGSWDVRFMLNGGGSLCYAAWNLWTPRK